MDELNLRILKEPLFFAVSEFSRNMAQKIMG